jgi:hypothetical protein
MNVEMRVHTLRTLVTHPHASKEHRTRRHSKNCKCKLALRTICTSGQLYEGQVSEKETSIYK